MAAEFRAPWPQVFEPGDWAEWARPGWADGGPDGIDALATLLALRREHQDRARRAEAELVGRPLPPSVLVVALAGPVASGKSTIAAAVAERLRSATFGVSGAVVSTDGFLRPTEELEAEGLLMRKGFPETYDLPSLRALVGSLRAGDDQITVPLYSHETFDIAPEPAVLDRTDVVVLEGVNALQGARDGGAGPADLADVTVYVEADEGAVIGWFVERFVELTIEARSDPDSFYRPWSDLPEGEVRVAARSVWDAVNGVNLREHIAPSRKRADIEVVKSPTHEILELRLHAT